MAALKQVPLIVLLGLALVSGRAWPQQKLDDRAQAAIDETVAVYCAAWGEPDAAKRRQMLQRVWAPEGTYMDPISQTKGVDGLVERINGFQSKLPGGQIVPSSRVDVHHNVLRFAWRLVGPDGAILNEGMDFATLAADGRLQSVVGFFGPVRTPGVR